MPSPRRYDAVWMNIDWKRGSCQQRAPISLSKPIHWEDAVPAQDEDSSNVWKNSISQLETLICLVIGVESWGSIIMLWLRVIGVQKSGPVRRKRVCFDLILGLKEDSHSPQKSKLFLGCCEPSPNAPWCHRNQFSSPPQIEHCCHHFHYFSDWFSPSEATEQKIFSPQVGRGWNLLFILFFQMGLLEEKCRNSSLCC